MINNWKITSHSFLICFYYLKMLSNCEINVPVGLYCLPWTEFLRLPQQITINRWHKQRVYSHSYRCQKSDVKSHSYRGQKSAVRATPLLKRYGEPFLTYSSFWWPQTPCLMAAELQSLPPSSHGLLPCVSVFLFSDSYKDTCYWI